MNGPGPRRKPLPSTKPEELSSMSLLALRARKAELNAVVAGLTALIEDAKGDITLAKAQMAMIRGEISSRAPARKGSDGGNTPQSKGGFARAASMSVEERREQASRAAKARWGTPDPKNRL